MLRRLWRWRFVVYACIGVLVGFFLIAVGHPASAQLVNTNNLDQSWQIGASGANLPNADLLSPMVSSLNSIQAQIQTYAERLFVLLVTLDVFWMVAQFLLTRDNLGEFLTQMFTKVFTVVFVYYVLIQHGPQLVTTVIGSFAYIPQNASISGQYLNTATPTALLAEGALLAAVPVAEAVGLDLIPDEGLGTGATNLSKAASEMLTGAAFAIFGAFAGLAAEIAIATLEVYVVLNLGIIVTGFLGSRWTEKYGQGFFAYAISAGVKYMFVQIILGLMYPYLLETAATEAIPVVGPAIYAAIAVMVVAIVHAVPSFAGSALSGQSNSSGAQLAGAMSQAFGGLAGGAKTLSGLPAANRASKAAAADQKFKEDQMEAFYGTSKYSVSKADPSRSANTDTASHKTASFEDKRPSTDTNTGKGRPTPSGGVASNGSQNTPVTTTPSLNGSLNPAAQTMFSGNNTQNPPAQGSGSQNRTIDTSTGPQGGSGTGTPPAQDTGTPGASGVQSNAPGPQTQLPEKEATPTLLGELFAGLSGTPSKSAAGPPKPRAMSLPPTFAGMTLAGKPLNPAAPVSAQKKANDEAQEAAKKAAETAPTAVVGDFAKGVSHHDDTSSKSTNTPPPIAPSQTAPITSSTLSASRPPSVAQLPKSTPVSPLAATLQTATPVQAPNAQPAVPPPAIPPPVNPPS